MQVPSHAVPKLTLNFYANYILYILNYSKPRDHHPRAKVLRSQIDLLDRFVDLEVENR